MHSPDKVDENITKIGNLFPNCITETLDETGKPVKAIDFDVLKQELSKVVVDGPKERYQFTWPDKKKSILLANSPISATLRPCRAESVNFDTTENLYIEGDNLDVLKLLQETYLGKVKMIYIDPPYNTGNDFVYADNFDIDNDSYKELSGDYDDQGNRLRKNNDTNGRFHTDWLNMMYPRLKLARDLLRDDGVIFISIDDNEVENLKKCCDEIFGMDNFVANFLWKKKSTTSNVEGAEVSSLLDSTLCYKKSSIAKIKQRIKEKETRTYPYTDKDGKYRTTVIEKKDSGGYKRESMKFPIMGYRPRDGKRWQIGEETAKDLERKNRFIYDGEKILLKIYDFEDKDTYSAQPNLLDFCGTSENASTAVNNVLFNIPELFTNPKPVELLQHLINITTQNDIILDFFSGSATTAHAVMQLNAEDGGKRKFIMVQIPEATDETSEAFKAGYKNICEIGKERIRRAGNKIREENSGKTGIEKLDCGFRVLKLDSSNMKDVHYSPEEFVNNPTLFDQVHDNIKEDRSGEDLLFQVMLDLGLELSAPVRSETISGKTVYTVKDNYLIACFDNDVTDELLTGIAKRKPFYAVLRDSSFTRDDTASNFEQIFATWSPETVKKVL